MVANRFGESTSAQRVTLSQAEVEQRIVNLVLSYGLSYGLQYDSQWLTVDSAWFINLNHGSVCITPKPCDPCIASVSLACGSRTLNPTRNSTGNVANAWDPGDTGGSQRSERMVVDQKAFGVDRSHTFRPFSLRMGWTLIPFLIQKYSKNTFSAQSGSQGLGCEGGPGANSARV